MTGFTKIFDTGYQNLVLQKILAPNVSISGSSRNTIVGLIKGVAEEAFGRSKDESRLEKHVIVDSDMLYILCDGPHAVGFSCYRHFRPQGTDVLYLNGIALRKDYQGLGLYSKLNLNALAELQYDYFVLRTQNPVVYAATARIVGKIFPNGEQIPREIADLASTISKEYLGAERFDANRLVGNSTYSGCLYDQLPKYQGLTCSIFEGLNLDCDKGDSVLIVGKVAK